MKQSQAEATARYVDLVRGYHRTLDLMSEAAVARLDEHIAEAEAYARMLGDATVPASRVLDLGSGVGLPGVIVAVHHPHLPVALVERRQRRAAFLRIVVGRLGLTNVTVHAQDVREVRTDPVAVVTAQAVSSFRDIYVLTRHLHAARIRLVARKGDHIWQHEVDELHTALGAAAGGAAGNGALEVRVEPREGRGTLVAVTAPGGLPCRPSD